MRTVAPVPPVYRIVSAGIGGRDVDAKDVDGRAELVERRRSDEGRHERRARGVESVLLCRGEAVAEQHHVEGTVARRAAVDLRVAKD